MDGRPRRGAIARRRALTAVACGALFALVGGALLATPADAGILGASDACTAEAPAPARAGAVDLSGSSGGVTLGDHCLTGVPATTPTGPQPAPAASDAAAPVPTTAPSPADPAAPAAPEPAAPTSTPSSAPVAVSGTPASSTALARLSVLRSSDTVYPVRDGYLDSVRFAVRAVNALGSFVPVVGSAVLSRGGRPVQTWPIDGGSRVITWNGRVGRAVRPGLYTLTVTARSLDGCEMVQHTLVRVLADHRERHALVVRQDVGARSVSADLPRRLLKAYATGSVTVRVRTVATVHGPAKLVYEHNGVARSLVLRNGTHTTRALPVPEGFSHVTISHDWAKGDAHLTVLQAIWTYYTLS